MSFMEELNEAIKVGEQARDEAKNNEDFFLTHRVSLSEKIYGIKNALKRAKDQIISNGLKSIIAEESEVIERQVCCSLCNKGRRGGTCPYCGCNIKKTWFLPLGKSELATEGCPNSNTYPHLKKFPQKNYWKVCQEKSSIIFFYKNDNISKLFTILDKLIKNATGSIEIVVGIKTDFDISFSEVANNIVFVKGVDNIDGLRDKAQGDYIFLLEECDYEDLGYDTKLKYKYVK